MPKYTADIEEWLEADETSRANGVGGKVLKGRVSCMVLVEGAMWIAGKEP
jgi:hypothetical protein